MAKPKRRANAMRTDVALPPGPTAPAESHALRETVESIVIAFVLAFLFRTFEAEAFVIPTGSMAPTLMGRHKDVDCGECGHRIRINAHEEEIQDVPLRAQQRHLARASCFAGMCPMCRHVMPLRPDLPEFVAERDEGNPIVKQPSYNGDRILVNKYLYTFSDPQRWDIVVFHFPGNSQVNYIKRLVGLPDEVIRVFQGDLFVAPNKEPGRAPSEDEFKIERKPADKVLAMRQLVHDTDYEPAKLIDAGWPLRWSAEPAAEGAWQVDTSVKGKTVRPRYSADAANDVAWLRYQHVVPSYDVWRQVNAHHADPSASGSQRLSLNPRPQLVTDFNEYNTRVSLFSINHHGDLNVDPIKTGLHWVGDLMVEAEVEVAAAEGELLLDLVEAGQHFTCTIDLTTGRATLAAGEADGFAPAADTPISKSGSYHVALANVDDQLLLWIDGELVEFDDSTEYDAGAVFYSREAIIPRTSAADPLDLAPAGIGARNAKLAVTRLALWRDIYYIASDWKRQSGHQLVTDFEHPFDQRLHDLAWKPSLWNRFDERSRADFPLRENQYFVMGDNSPESSDARLWMSGDPRSGGKPGGAYLERRQLIGKALCVYWPHSWNRIPGTPIPFPLFPNFSDMRLVR